MVQAETTKQALSIANKAFVTARETAKNASIKLEKLKKQKNSHVGDFISHADDVYNHSTMLEKLKKKRDQAKQAKITAAQKLQFVKNELRRVEQEVSFCCTVHGHNLLTCF